MKINHLGHSELLKAIQRMTTELELDCCVDKFTTIFEYSEGGYDLLILDSQHFKTVILPNLDLINSHVLVLGHYTDGLVQQAFCIDEGFSYIAYSKIESELPHYLNSILTKIDSEI